MSSPVPGPRLMLRPGLIPVRRDTTHLQVGLTPPLRVLLPDAPAVRRLLRPSLATLPVLSYSELAGCSQIRALGTVVPPTMAVPS